MTTTRRGTRKEPHGCRSAPDWAGCRLPLCAGSSARTAVSQPHPDPPVERTILRTIARPATRRPTGDTQRPDQRRTFLPTRQQTAPTPIHPSGGPACARPPGQPAAVPESAPLGVTNPVGLARAERSCRPADGPPQPRSASRADHPAYFPRSRLAVPGRRLPRREALDSSTVLAQFCSEHRAGRPHGHLRAGPSMGPGETSSVASAQHDVCSPMRRGTLPRRAGRPTTTDVEHHP